MMSRSAARRQSTLELAALMLLTTVTCIVCAAAGYRRRINHTRPAEGVPTLVEPDGIHGPVHKMALYVIKMSCVIRSRRAH